MRFNKKGGVVGDLISGTGGLIVLVIIVLLIVSTLLGASLLGSDTTSTETTTNELNGRINGTAYQLGTSNSSLSNYAITQATNSTSGLVILVGNYTLNTTAGTVTNATTTVWLNVSYNWTATFTYDNQYKSSTDLMAGNFTSGIDNVSTKIPTILLIAAVVLLFGVIVLLIRQSGAMGIGGGGASL